ncbi:MAG: ABC transporter permease [Acidimicrobiales bacterium]
MSSNLPRGPRPALTASITELVAYRSLIWNLAQREIKVKYKRSVLGWLWSLINPATQLLTYTIVFGYFFRAEPPVAGNGELKNYSIYLFTGLVTWNFFSNTVNGCLTSMVGAGPLMKKVYFPPVCAPIATTIAVLAQTAVEFGILAAVLIVVGNVGISFLLLFPLLLVLLLFSLGVGLALSVYNVYYRDVGYLVGVALNLLFYATPIIFTLDIVPERIGRIPVLRLIRLNPLTQFVGAVRDAMYHLQAPSLARAAGIVVVALLALVVGWAMFHRKAADISEEL